MSLHLAFTVQLGFMGSILPNLCLKRGGGQAYTIAPFLELSLLLSSLPSRLSALFLLSSWGLYVHLSSLP